MQVIKHESRGGGRPDGAALDYESAAWIAQLISDGAESLAAAIEQIEEATGSDRRLPEEDIAGEISQAMCRVDELYSAYESADIWATE